MSMIDEADSGIVVDFPEPVSVAPVSLESLQAEIVALREEQTQILVVLQEYRDILGPTIEGMKNSPIGAMLGMKGK